MNDLSPIKPRISLPFRIDALDFGYTVQSMNSTEQWAFSTADEAVRHAAKLLGIESKTPKPDKPNAWAPIIYPELEPCEPEEYGIAADAYDHVAADLSSRIPGMRATWQVYRGGYVGFGVFFGCPGFEPGWAVVVINPDPAHPALAEAVAKTLLKAMRTEPPVWAHEPTTPRAHRLFLEPEAPDRLHPEDMIPRTPDATMPDLQTVLAWALNADPDIAAALRAYLEKREPTMTFQETGAPRMPAAGSFN